MVFERNQGQHERAVRYAARGAGYRYGFTDDAIHVRLAGHPSRQFALRPAGRAQRTAPAGEAPLASRVNYFHGRNGSAWHAGVPTFGRVRYPAAWPGVDLTFYGSDRQLEYDVEVAPGADAASVRFALDGVESITVSTSGELVAMADAHPVIFSPPVAYQVIDGARRHVAATYVVDGREFRFAVGRYDRSRPLVIDPVLVYSTFLGGNFFDRVDHQRP
jgi:hypothetical protein